MPIIPAPLQVPRRRARRAVSLLEATFALVLLIIAAAALTNAVARSTSVQVEVREERLARMAAADVLDTLATQTFDLLADNPAVVLPLWNAEESGCADEPEGHPIEPTVFCLSLPQVGDRPLRIERQEQGDGLLLTATVGLPTAVADAVVRRSVPAPWPSYAAADRTSVRLRLTGDGPWPDTLYLIRWQPPSEDDPPWWQPDAGGPVGAAPVEDGVALFDVPADACPPAAPCRPALTDNPPYATVEVDDGAGDQPVTLAPEDVAGTAADIVTVGGGFLDRTVAVGPAATQTVSLAGGTGSPEDGSVCLWGRLSSGTHRFDVPACNNGAKVVFARFAPDPSRPDLRVGLPDGAPMVVSVNRDDGACPYIADVSSTIDDVDDADGGFVALDLQGQEIDGGASMVGATSDGWATSAVCTSWTWGYPEGLPALVQVGADVPVVPFAAELAWAAPREAAGCAADGTCRALPVGYDPCDEENPGCMTPDNWPPS